VTAAGEAETGGLTLKDLGLIVLMNFAWGGNFVVAKFAVMEIPPLFAAAVRFFIVALVCIPWLKIHVGRMRSVLTLALFMGCLHFVFVFLAISITQKVSGLAIVSQLGVPIGVLMAVVLLKERIGIWRISGITIAFLGALVLGFDPVIFQDLDAVGLMLIGVILMCYASILMRGLRGVSPMELQAWVGVVSVLPLLGLSLIVEFDDYQRIIEASWSAWAAVVYSAVVASLIAHVINFYLLQRYPVSTVAPYSLLAPVVGVFAAVVFLGDALTLELIVGGVITLSGVMLVSVRNIATKKRQAT